MENLTLGELAGDRPFHPLRVAGFVALVILRWLAALERAFDRCPRARCATERCHRRARRNRFFLYTVGMLVRTLVLYLGLGYVQARKIPKEVPACKS